MGESRGIWPRGPFYDMDVFRQAIALGPEALRRSAQAFAVSTPGTLGEKGAWRVAGHRISIADMLEAMLRFDDSDGDDPSHFGMDDLVALASAYFGWPQDGPSRDKLVGAAAFALLFPELALEHALERGRPGLERALRACVEPTRAAYESWELERTTGEARAESSGAIRI